MTHDAAGRLAIRHRGLAYRYAKTYLRRGFELEELTAEALLALYRAALEYEADRGPFTAWARMNIKQHLIKVLRSSAAAKRVGVAVDVDSVTCLTRPTQERDVLIREVKDGFRASCRRKASHELLDDLLAGNDLSPRSMDQARAAARRTLFGKMVRRTKESLRVIPPLPGGAA